jgi:hypothetical protein
MAEGLDDAAISFQNEIAPQSRPRDSAGKFVQTAGRPEPMFSPRPIEGDPLTGDTSDGGDDPRLLAREREIADGRAPRREAEDDHPAVDTDPENIGSVDEDDEVDEPAIVEEDGQKYEVVVDGDTVEVSLQEALRGYIREATFHKRLAQLNEVQQQIDADVSHLNQNWAMWNKARADFEEDAANITPKEPDWDQEFATDPQNAYLKRKMFEAIYAKLAASRKARADREAVIAEDTNRRTQKYAVDGFTKFVMNNAKLLPDQKTLEKNLQSMRRTAMAVGFSEYEVQTVYDPRMLTILLKASKYDRMTANKPVAIIPGKGKTLTPGAATPLGNARRSGFDDAQSRLAQTGKMQDAVEVFRRML